MNHLKLTVTFPVFCLLASLSCMPFPQGYQQGAFPSQVGQQQPGVQQGASNYNPPPNDPPERSDEDYDNMRKNNRDRDEVLDRSRSRRKGEDCGDEARGHECISICREIYKRRDDREDCEDLTVNQVYALADVYDVLKDPDLDDLLDLDLEDVNVFLELSIAGLDHLIKEYSKNDAKNVLTWIAEDENIAEELEDGDDEFKSLEKLLDKVSSFNENTVEKPFGAEIDNDYTLFELAFNADNEAAADWFLDFAFHKSTHCNDEGKNPDAACLTVICKIGYNFDDDSMRASALDFSAWTDFFDDVISAPIKSNKDNWCPSDVRQGANILTSSDELEDNGDYDYEGDWVKTLCRGLITGFTSCP